MGRVVKLLHNKSKFSLLAVEFSLPRECLFYLLVIAEETYLMREIRRPFTLQILSLVVMAILLHVISISAFADENGNQRYLVYRPKSSGIFTKDFKSLDVHAQEVHTAVTEAGGSSVLHLPLIKGVVATISDRDFARAAEKLQAVGLVVEHDYPVHALKAPNDSYYSTYQSDMAAIAAPQAWDVTTGSSSVVVGVLDTGIDYSHPDLTANMWSDPIGGNYGWNFITNTSDPMDDHYHGTHVAGTIAASGNNGIGVSGVTWSTKLMALKVLDKNGSGSVSGIIAGIQYAVAQKQRGVNIRVLNASLGGPGYSAAFQDAITSAYNAGILFVAAAGNEGSDNGKSLTYPADYAHVLSVAAVDNSGKLASFSNFGSNSVQIAAPGVDILNTIPLAQAPSSERAYAFLSGTSMAAPHVAGAAALVLSAFPLLTPDQIQAKLLGGAVQNPGLNGKVTSGMLNVTNALTVATKVTISGTVKIGGRPLAGVVVSDVTLGSVVSDTSGYFSFASVPLGTPYQLSATKDGYTFTLSSNAMGTAMASTQVSIIGVVATAQLQGTLRANGKAFAGVTVTAEGIGTTSTNSSGSFVFRGLPLKSVVTLRFTKAGYVIPGPTKVTMTGNVTVALSYQLSQTNIKIGSKGAQLINRQVTVLPQ